MDLRFADAILIMGSNMAECHPVGFRFVMQAKLRGAKVLHADPRFTRTSAMADVYAPLRAGTDIVFLGALVKSVLDHIDVLRAASEEEDQARRDFFLDYLLHYTNAP